MNQRAKNLKTLTYWLILLLAFCLVSESYSQQTKKIDSLEKLLKTNLEDSTRISIQIELCEYYYFTDTVKANKCLATITTELDINNKISSWSLFRIGKLYNNKKNDFHTAIKYYQLATDKAIEENDFRSIEYEG
jgi:hypothetical protein